MRGGIRAGTWASGLFVVRAAACDGITGVNRPGVPRGRLAVFFASQDPLVQPGPLYAPLFRSLLPPPPTSYSRSTALAIGRSLGRGHAQTSLALTSPHTHPQSHPLHSPPPPLLLLPETVRDAAADGMDHTYDVAARNVAASSLATAGATLFREAVVSVSVTPSSPPAKTVIVHEPAPPPSTAPNSKQVGRGVADLVLLAAPEKGLLVHAPLVTCRATQLLVFAAQQLEVPHPLPVLPTSPAAPPSHAHPPIPEEEEEEGEEEVGGRGGGDGPEEEGGGEEEDGEDARTERSDGTKEDARTERSVATATSATSTSSSPPLPSLRWVRLQADQGGVGDRSGRAYLVVDASSWVAAAVEAADDSVPEHASSVPESDKPMVLLRAACAWMYGAELPPKNPGRDWWTREGLYALAPLLGAEDLETEIATKPNPLALVDAWRRVWAATGVLEQLRRQEVEEEKERELDGDGDSVGSDEEVEGGGEGSEEEGYGEADGVVEGPEAEALDAAEEEEEEEEARGLVDGDDDAVRRRAMAKIKAPVVSHDILPKRWAFEVEQYTRELIHKRRTSVDARKRVAHGGRSTYSVGTGGGASVFSGGASEGGWGDDRGDVGTNGKVDKSERDGERSSIGDSELDTTGDDLPPLLDMGAPLAPIIPSRLGSGDGRVEDKKPSALESSGWSDASSEASAADSTVSYPPSPVRKGMAAIQMRQRVNRGGEVGKGAMPLGGVGGSGSVGAGPGGSGSVGGGEGSAGITPPSSISPSTHLALLDLGNCQPSELLAAAQRAAEAAAAAHGDGFARHRRRRGKRTERALQLARSEEDGRQLLAMAAELVILARALTRSIGWWERAPRELLHDPSTPHPHPHRPHHPHFEDDEECEAARVALMDWLLGPGWAAAAVVPAGLVGGAVEQALLEAQARFSRAKGALRPARPHLFSRERLSSTALVLPATSLLETLQVGQIGGAMEVLPDVRGAINPRDRKAKRRELGRRRKAAEVDARRARAARAAAVEAAVAVLSGVWGADSDALLPPTCIAITHSQAPASRSTSSSTSHPHHTGIARTTWLPTAILACRWPASLDASLLPPVSRNSAHPTVPLIRAPVSNPLAVRFLAHFLALGSLPDRQRPEKPRDVARRCNALLALASFATKSNPWHIVLDDHRGEGSESTLFESVVQRKAAEEKKPSATPATSSHPPAPPAPPSTPERGEEGSGDGREVNDAPQRASLTALIDAELCDGVLVEANRVEVGVATTAMETMEQVRVEGASVGVSELLASRSLALASALTARDAVDAGGEVTVRVGPAGSGHHGATEEFLLLRQRASDALTKIAIATNALPPPSSTPLRTPSSSSSSAAAGFGDGSDPRLTPARSTPGRRDASAWSGGSPPITDLFFKEGRR